MSLTALCLQQIIDNLFSIFAVATIADMHPVGSRLGVLFPDELVELAVLLNELKPRFSLLNIAVDAEVSRLALHVLTIADTANSSIQRERTIAGAYLHLFSPPVTKRL